MKTIEIKLYTYEELNADAQAKARDWWREGWDDFFSECILEDFEAIALLMGFTIDSRDAETVSGKTFRKPKIYWSGFWSQGDGACFEGAWTASDVKPGKVAEFAPLDKELHRIAAVFEAAAKSFPEASFSVRHAGHYYHAHSTRFDIEFGEDVDYDVDTAQALTEAARDLMDWLYRKLEKEYEWQNADEQVAETIIANEYYFTQDGVRSELKEWGAWTETELKDNVLNWHRILWIAACNIRELSPSLNRIGKQ